MSASPSLIGRLLGRTESERLQRYTAGSGYLLFGFLPFLSVMLVVDTDRSESRVAAAIIVWGVGVLVQAVLAAFTYRASLNTYLHAVPLPRKLWVLLAALTVVLAVGAVLFPRTDGYVGEAGVGSSVAVLAITALCGMVCALPRRSAEISVVAVVALQLGVDLLFAEPQTALLVYAFYTALLAILFIPTMRLVGWMLAVVRQLDQGRATSARLAVAEERLRFSRDLHDVIGRSLSAISLKTEVTAALLERDRTEQARAELAQVRELAAEALKEMRAVVAGYRGADLTAELEGAHALLASTGVELHVVGEEAAKDLPDAVREGLAWAVREGTTNIVRHANPTWATLTFAREGTTARLVLTNDGVSVRPGGRAGSGLAGLDERLNALGGSASARREANTFTLLVEMPVP